MDTQEKDIVDELLELFGSDVDEYVVETVSSKHIETVVLRIMPAKCLYHKLKIVIQDSSVASEEGIPTLRFFVTPKDHLLTPMMFAATLADMRYAKELVDKYLPLLYQFSKDRGFLIPTYDLPSGFHE